jgi:amino acid adenylation domain-containing protein
MHLKIPQTFTNICQLFEQQVERSPDAIAVIFENHQLTYLELHQRSTQLAYYLKSIGAQPNTLIGLCVYNCLDLMVGILGILKSGSAYLPLDPSYPQERLEWMLNDSKPAIVLSQKTLLHQFTHYEGKVVVLENVWEKCHCLDQALLSFSEIAPHHLAYVIYTSGSTGKPKGIMVTHESFPHLALAHQEYYPSQLIGLLTGSISFDVSILIIFHILISGGVICIPAHNISKDANEMIEFIQKHAINFLVCVPSFYALILDKGHPLPSLASVSLAGENIPKDLLKKHSQLACNSILYNEYGPTEYAIGTTIAKIYDPIAHQLHPVTVGQPLPHTQVYILDENLQLLPVGMKGEICIGGIGLAKGYFNQPELTAERFIRISFANSLSMRLYRTGDFGRLLSDGNFEFLGRMDHQVKIRGYRIELGEIEHTICKYPDVNEAVVVVRGDEELGNKQLITYFSAFSKKPLNELLRTYLKNQLPGHMIPSIFIQLEKFPRTPNGKIDRDALPDISEIREKYEREKPQTELEQHLLDIWETTLHMHSIGREDHFFDLGGSSLQIAHIQTLIEKRLQIKIPITDLYQYPTIAKLAQHLNQQHTAPSELENQENAEKRRLAFSKLRKRAQERNSVYEQ